MKASSLHELWASPDNSRLTSKQFSFRLPTHVAAKIAALCEMFPNKNRTQVVADLLTSALDELERSLPGALGERADPKTQHLIDEHEGTQGEAYHRLGGLRGQFQQLANRHYREIEHELGNESPPQLFPDSYLTKSDLEKGKP